jgi:hypothetical protein
MIAKNSTGSFINSNSQWTRRLQQVPGGTTFACGLFFAIAAPSMANPVITWGTAAACAAQAFNFTGMAGGFGVLGGAGTGTANPHTSSSLTSSAANSLVVAFDFQLSLTAQGTTPTGWSSLWANGDATSGMAFAGWSIALTSVGSASGAISVTEGAVAWLQVQHELLLDLQGQINI